MLAVIKTIQQGYKLTKALREDLNLFISFKSFTKFSP